MHQAFLYKLIPQMYLNMMIPFIQYFATTVFEVRNATLHRKFTLAALSWWQGEKKTCP